MDTEAGFITSESARLRWTRFHSNRPPYIIPITVLTGIYLAFELSFNARLLDVVGGLPSQTEVKSIEHWGRYISGIALALAIWGSLLMPMGVKHRWDASRWALFLIGSAVIAIYAVYTLEGDLIDYLTDRADGATRQRALYLGALRVGIVNGQIEVPTMNLTARELASPEGKTFAALFPVLAYSDNRLIDKADSALTQLAEKSIDAKNGTAGQAFARYRELVRHIGVGLFNGVYAPALDRLHDRLADIPQKQAAAWNDYVSRLPSGTTPDNIPADMDGTVRDKLRTAGIQVPDGWQPNDQTGFYNAVQDAAQTEAHAAFQSEIKPIIDELEGDAVVPEELTWQAFLTLPAVQGHIRTALGLPDSIRLPTTMNGETFEQLVYLPLKSASVRQAMACYRSAPEAFAAGGREQEAGARFMRLLLVPPIALAFSLIGALVHITKFSNYSLRLLFNRSWLNIRTIGCAIAALGLSAFLAPNAVTLSDGFGAMRNEAHATLGPGFVSALIWVIQAQHFAYPFDEAVRNNVLRGANFGYNPNGHTDAARALPNPCATQPDA